MDALIDGLVFEAFAVNCVFVAWLLGKVFDYIKEKHRLYCSRERRKENFIKAIIARK